MFLVMAFHHWTFLGSPKFSLAGLPLHKPLAYGFVGVHLFFVLSGFCLAWPYFGDEAKSLEKFSVKAFLQRRFWRLAPAYYAVLLLMAAKVLIISWHRTGAAPEGFWPDLAAHLLFIHNLNGDHLASYNMVFWTLGVQFQLYCLFPVLLLFSQRAGLLAMGLTVLLGELVYRFAIWPFLVPGDWPLNFSLAYALPGRMFELAAGIILAALLKQYPTMASAPKNRFLVLLLGVISGVLAFQLSESYTIYYPPVDALWALAVVAGIWLGFTPGRWRQFLELRPLVFCGMISYSLYLVHHPIGVWLYHRVYFNPQVPGLLQIAAAWLYIPLMLLTGWVLYRWLEKPLSAR